MSFIRVQVLESCMKLLTTEGADQSRAHEEMFQNMDVLEEGMRSLASRDFSSKNRENLDLLDIMIVATLGVFRAQEESLGLKILDKERHPLIYEWVAALIEVDVVKEVTPQHDAVVSFLQHFKRIANNS